MSMYYYNGKLLPTIPEDATTNYLYFIIIIWSSGNIQLIGSKNGFYFTGSNNTVRDKGSTVLRAYNLRNGIWTIDTNQNEKYTGWNILEDDVIKLHWSNFDIPDWSSSNDDSAPIFFNGTNACKAINILTPDTYIITKDSMIELANKARRLEGIENELTLKQMKEIFTKATISGGEVQRAEGTFTPDSSGQATVECGFKPDLLFVNTGGSTNYNGITYIMSGAFAFTEETRTDQNATMATAFAYLGNEEGYYDVTAMQTDSGFQLKILLNGSPFTYNVNYVAVNYSDLGSGGSGSSDLPLAEEVLFG